MRTKTVLFVGLLACLALVSTLPAQEGHPLTGTWHGEWGPQHTRAVLYLHWEGNDIAGMVNPGPNSVPLKVVKLDAATWTVHLEADGKDKSGAAVHVVIDGKMDNLGSYNRTITGTWTQGTNKGDLKLTRDS